MKFLSLTVVEISLTKNLERKKKEQTKGRTNRRMLICNPTIQLVVVNTDTARNAFVHFSISFIVFSEGLLWNL